MAEAITVTFGDRAENHARMQIIGEARDEGFSAAELRALAAGRPDATLAATFPAETDACVLILRDYAPPSLFDELRGLDWDKKAYMYGRVCEKRARWNLCFGESAQEPDYENKRGRIIPWGQVPQLSQVRDGLAATLGAKAADLVGEGNYYFPGETGIGFHGDAERRIVVALRLHSAAAVQRDFALYYQWYWRGEPQGPKIAIPLTGGELYVMSEKAVGTDWRRTTVPTLRHATGADKFVGPRPAPAVAANAAALPAAPPPAAAPRVVPPHQFSAEECAAADEALAALLA